MGSAYQQLLLQQSCSPARVLLSSPLWQQWPLPLLCPNLRLNLKRKHRDLSALAITTIMAITTTTDLVDTLATTADTTTITTTMDTPATTTEDTVVLDTITTTTTTTVSFKLLRTPNR